jgi:tyrosyl-tRNA synthetase
MRDSLKRRVLRGESMTPEQQVELLRHGAEEIIPEDELVARIRLRASQGRPIRVKQGFDPTAPDIHLGHSVGLRKLRQFQDLGAQVVLIVGDYTARVGDPSGVSKTRPQLSEDEIEANARTYLEQFYRVLERDPRPPRLPVEVHRNGEWFSAMPFVDVIRLTSRYTVARLLERDDFAKRTAARAPIGVHELLYPIMQGYDSVAIQADVELGGTDQKFNLLVGRALQEAYGQPPQIILTVPLLPGLDGVQRMSKSLRNYIGVTDAPDEMFGKVMSIPDGIMMLYWRLTTDAPPEELREIEGDLSQQRSNPMHIKQRLARRLVAMYHGSEPADRAERHFKTQFSQREIPEDLEEFHRAEVDAVQRHSDRPLIAEYLVAGGFAPSKSAARRLVAQGAVSLDGQRVTELEAPIDAGRSFVLRAGRRMKRYQPTA